MQNELQSLEAKVAQLVTLFAQSRAEAHGLRSKVVALESANHHMGEKIQAASTRLEGLMAALPDSPPGAE